MASHVIRGLIITYTILARSLGVPYFLSFSTAETLFSS